MKNSRVTHSFQFSSVQSLSLWPRGLQHAKPPCPSSTPRVYQTYVHWVSDVIKPSHRPLPPSLPLLYLSQHQGLFSNEFFIKCPKYWSVSFSISPSDEYSGLISFRTDWFDLFVALGTPKSLLLHHRLKASIFWHSAFFMVQLLETRQKKQRIGIMK